MDKSKAIELLKECLSRISYLETLHHDNNEQYEWIINLVDVASAFGHDSKEYKLIHSFLPLPVHKSDKENQAEYLLDLSRHEAIIIKILKDNGVMSSIWITYDWDDNKDRDVDYCAQELTRAGLDVKLDRWNLGAGKQLWEQIEHFIQNPELSDGWVFYATQLSLVNEKCKEELNYALDRALNKRGSEFPIIALFPSSVDEQLIPASIRTRLYVSITDPDWKERIVAAVQKRTPIISKTQVEPYVLKVHKSGGQFMIEMRPRAGSWSPFIAGIPLAEKDRVSPHLHHGAANRPPTGIIMTSLFGYREGTSNGRKLWCISASNEATPTQSYYLICKSLPTFLIFGVDRGSPQYQVTFPK